MHGVDYSVVISGGFRVMMKYYHPMPFGKAGRQEENTEMGGGRQREVENVGK